MSNETHWQDVSQIRISDGWVIVAQVPISKRTTTDIPGPSTTATAIQLRYILRGALGVGDRSVSPDDAAKLIAMAPRTAA